MAITEATIRDVKYPPELLPDTWYGNVPAGSEVAPVILDLKRFSPNAILELRDIQLTANANVNIRARYDNNRVEQNTAALLSLFPNAWRLPAITQLYYNLFGAILVANYTTFYNVLAYPPTVAHKLLWGMNLTIPESELADELGLRDTVQKGLLPLPLNQIIEREYSIAGEETHVANVNINLPNTVFPIETIYTKPNEILALTRVAANPGGAANNIQITVDRDNDNSYLSFQTFPLSLVLGGEVSCFVPATTQIRLTTTATVAPGAHLFRYTIQRIRLNNILRLRFGLMNPADAPADLYKKVIGGVV